MTENNTIGVLLIFFPPPFFFSVSDREVVLFCLNGTKRAFSDWQSQSNVARHCLNKSQYRS